jgi:AcrR family transcriptional regulator
MSPSTQAGLRTREAVLSRAVDLASVEGLEGLTIGRLATDLKMSKSGLFDRFGSKQELQLATVERATAVFWREVVEPAGAATAGIERLRALFEGYLRYLERDTLPGGCFMCAASTEFDGRPGAVRDAIAAAGRAWGSELLGQAELAGEQGALPAGVTPAQVVFELSAYANQANGVYQLERDRGAFARARSAAARILGS